jgi:hypothetical protein
VNMIAGLVTFIPFLGILLYHRHEVLISVDGVESVVFSATAIFVNSDKACAKQQQVIDIISKHLSSASLN